MNEKPGREASQSVHRGRGFVLARQFFSKETRGWLFSSFVTRYLFNRCLCPVTFPCFHGIVTIEPSVLWERSHKFDIPRAIRVERMVRGWLDVLDPGKSREGRVLRRMKGFARRFGITCEIWTKTRIRTKVFFLICLIR